MNPKFLVLVRLNACKFFLHLFLTSHLRYGFRKVNGITYKEKNFFLHAIPCSQLIDFGFE
jgi:hypothetical protein